MKYMASTKTKVRRHFDLSFHLNKHLSSCCAIQTWVGKLYISFFHTKYFDKRLSLYIYMVILYSQILWLKVN
jgi:hypothetical protein